MKKIICFLLLLLVISGVYAKSHSFSVVTDLAYYPRSESKINVNNTHFSFINGPFSALEARVTGNYFYTIPTPFGTNPLVKDNNLKLNAAFELSPVSVMPIFQANFTPIAFLVFTAGGKIGTGWDFAPLNVQGSAIYNDTTKKFTSTNPFQTWMMQFWFDSLFQFDIGAIVPGDWTHVVMLASYKVFYQRLTSAPDGEIWKWQGTADYCNGWKYYSSFLLGYQMPLLLQTVALQCELEGYLGGGNFATRYENWNPAFMEIALSPVAILKFNKMHQLTIQARFKSRRSYTEAIAENESAYNKTFASREWCFNRIAFSYEVKF